MAKYFGVHANDATLDTGNPCHRSCASLCYFSYCCGLFRSTAPLVYRSCACANFSNVPLKALFALGATVFPGARIMAQYVCVSEKQKRSVVGYSSGFAMRPQIP